MARSKKSQLSKKDHETPAQVGTSSSPVLETTLSLVFVLILSLIHCLDLFKEYYIFQSKIIPTKSSSSFSAISSCTPRHQDFDPSLYSIRLSTEFIWTAKILDAGKAIYLATLSTSRPNPNDMQIQISPSITNDYDEHEEFEMDFN